MPEQNEQNESDKQHSNAAFSGTQQELTARIPMKKVARSSET